MNERYYRGRCIPFCDDGQRVEGDACVPICGEGTRLDGENCVSVCDDGERFSNGRCESVCGQNEVFRTATPKAGMVSSTDNASSTAKLECVGE